MPDLVGTMLVGRYRVEEMVGRGGMAEVYRAFDHRRSYEVAIKVVREDYAEDPAFVRRFQAEAQSLASLSHQNIVRFYSFEQDGPVAFIVMDYICGFTLRRYLRDRNAPLPPAEALYITRQVVAALNYAHSEGILHRDVKPGNIMLQPDGRVLLSDFGIAKVADATIVTTVAPGTPAFMSPEQCRGERLDGRSDIYSLGIVLYQMLAGQLPFVGDGAPENLTSTGARVQWEHIHAPPPSPRQLNPALTKGLAEVVTKALAKKPAERYASVLDLWYALEGRCPMQPNQLFTFPLAEAAPARPTSQSILELRLPADHPTPAKTPNSADVSSPLGDKVRPKWRAVIRRLSYVAVGVCIIAGIVFLIVRLLENNPSGPVGIAAADPVRPIPALVATAGGSPAQSVVPQPIGSLLTVEPAEVISGTVPALSSTTATASPTSTPTVTPTDTPTSTPTVTLLPTITPSLSPGFTVANASVNVRSGPGTVYPAIGALRAGQAFAITGRNEAGDWWQFDLIGRAGWVSNSVVSANAAALAAPLQAAPPTPIASPTSALRIGSTWTSPVDGMVQVYVPAGEFLMGSTDDDLEAEPNEKPQRRVYLDAFWIDRTEVTLAQYRQCIKAGKCEPIKCAPPRGSEFIPDGPVFCVNWYDAAAYCQWAGQRLPSEAEWEKAARGTDGRKYPWGNAVPDCSLANIDICGKKVVPVGSFKTGASPYGVLDMAGNAEEWVADWYDWSYYVGAPTRNPVGPVSGSSRTSRGGLFYRSAAENRTTYRRGASPTSFWVGLGFRCARSG